MSYDLPLTLAIVKEQLGIDNTDSDAAITAKIPEAEAKFRQVANYDFNYVFCPIYDTASDTIKVYRGPNSEIDHIKYGDIILSAGHPQGTYVTQNFKIPQNDVNGLYYELKVSQDSTAASSSIGTETILCYNISHYAVLSQLVWFMIGEQSTSKVGKPGVKSKKAGPISTTYSDGDMNQIHGLPNKIMRQIPKYMSGY